MKSNSSLTKKPAQFIKRAVYGLTFLLCLVGCRKENIPATAIAIKFPQQAVITAVLKANATEQEFNDMDFSTMQVANFNGKAYLAKIKSKTDNSKVLIYSKKSGIIHARWVQIKPGANPSSGVISVSSVNESNRIESSFSNGVIVSSNRIIKAPFTNLALSNKAKQVSNASTSSTGGKFGARSFDDLGGDGDTGDGGDDLGNGDGTFDGGDGLGNNDGTGDQSLDGTGNNTNNGLGSSSGDPVAYNILLDNVVITATPINSEDSVTLYSLYFLFGNNPTYTGQYSTDPNGVDGSVITVLQRGTYKGVDPNFDRTKATGSPLIKNTPGLFVGYVVSFSYTKGPNGSVTVSSLTAALGGLTLGNTFTTLVPTFTVSGSIISFNITGFTDYNIVIKGIGTVLPDPTVIIGTYDTSNGAYTMTINGI